MSDPSTPRRSPRLGVLRVVLLSSLVGLMLPTLLGLLVDLVTGGSSGSWVPIGFVNLGFVLGLYVAPVTGVGALVVMCLRLLIRGEGDGRKAT